MPAGELDVALTDEVISIRRTKAFLMHHTRELALKPRAHPGSRLGLNMERSPWSRVPAGTTGPNEVFCSVAGLWLMLAVSLFWPGSTCLANLIDLRQATIVWPPDLTGPERKAVQVLQQEVQKRTQIEWPIRSEWPAAGDTIAVGPLRGLARFAAPFAQELNQWSQLPNAPE